MSSYCLECSKLGQDCCRESHAKFLTLGDAARIAEFLNDEIKSFALYGELNYKDKEEHIYIHKHQNYYYDLTLEDDRLLQLKDKSDGSCFFQEEDGRCRIYPARPLICRTYPFWQLENGEVIFDGCSSDCRIVCAITGNDDFEDVAKLEDRGGENRSKALEYIGHTRSSIKELLGQMMSEIEDYKVNIHTFVSKNRINIP